VGYEEGGQLTEKVRRKPVLGCSCDEIEKAHPEVFNVLLRSWTTVCSPTAPVARWTSRTPVIIMTSNWAAGRSLGRQAPGVQACRGGQGPVRRDQEHGPGRAQATFNPEFLNRIDDVIVFHALTREDMRAIVGILMGQVKERLGAQEIHLEISAEAEELLIDRGFDPALGARPLKRAIQRLLEDPLSEFILRGQLPAGGIIRVTRKEDQLDFAPAARTEPAATAAALPRG
jgi:ATP-dependent Clp protease ATP-binding subunit ClpC